MWALIQPDWGSNGKRRLEWTARLQECAHAKKRPCEEVAIHKPRRDVSEQTSSPDTLFLDFQPPELWENKFLLSKPLNKWHFVTTDCSSDGKESACNAGDPGSILGSRSCPGEGNDNPLQYSWLENRMDEGAWRATVHGVAKSRTRLSDWYYHPCG